MREYVWIMSFREVLFNIQVITCFPSDALDICIRGMPQDTFSRKVLDGSSLTLLQEQGYRVFKMDDPSVVLNYENILLNNSGLGQKGEFCGKSFPHARCLLMVHAADGYVASDNQPAHWHLYASQRQAETGEYNKVLPSDNKKLFDYIASLPENERDAFACAGLYHIGSWAKKRQESKSLLQQELAETHHFDFDPGKPVVAFLLDEFCHEQQLFEGLQRLAPHVNLVVKGGRLPPVPGAFHYPNFAFAPNLLRFAADCLLAGYHSGTLASSVMLGLPVIPYYTTMVYTRGRSNAPRARHDFYLDRDRFPDSIHLDILETLNPPLNLLHTGEVLDRLNDASWWADYARRLPGAQKAIFGNYAVDDAPQKAAKLIKRVFEQGTFGEDTAAVRLRPEAGRIGRISRAERGRP